MRTRYVWDRDLEKVVEVFDHNKARKNSGPFFMRDIEQHYGAPIISPINGEHITSRSQLRAHEQRYECKQAGDFKPGELISKEKRRHEANRRAAEGGTVTWG